MMMPLAGGRKVSDALRIISQVFERNIESWEEDNATFIAKKRKKARPLEKPQEVARKKPRRKKR